LWLVVFRALKIFYDWLCCFHSGTSMRRTNSVCLALGN